ncbi:uncharacterized protein ARMOST_18760 [Armillaria ostoyae]|uniref:Ig-like domain-containing protein n=1 Tax=Armillaria ostoyae TaxID=47428 RepID=A0A284S2M7_ARMOS|nr:uncharacterized protein ARMOST_18760 [Armillaria ostoyae]
MEASSSVIKSQSHLTTHLLDRTRDQAVYCIQTSSLNRRGRRLLWCRDGDRITSTPSWQVKAAPTCNCLDAPYAFCGRTLKFTLLVIAT